MIDCTVVIPARNEEWLAETCADVLAASGDRTKVLVILDGELSDKPLPEHDRLDVIGVPESIGQRAATNLGIKIGNTKYAMKLDGHCAMEPGFDEKLIQAAQELGPDVIQVPLQYNLHVFNRKCTQCRFHEDMGPSWDVCPRCGAKGTMFKELVWKRRMNSSKRSSGWYFDKDLHFQYWGEWGDRNAHLEIHDVMSCLGACWFVDVEWFKSVGMLDETHGSWGQMGTELACKAWTSGGRMVVNKKTWFAHMFRTQGGDFGFPYPLSGKEVGNARAYSRKLWLDTTWPLAKRRLIDIVDHFGPTFPTPGKKNPSWTAEDIEALRRKQRNHIPPAGNTREYAPKPIIRTTQNPTIGTRAPLSRGIVWYSDAFNRGDDLFQEIVQASWSILHKAAPKIPIVAVVLGDLKLRGNHSPIRMEAKRDYLTMFRQILAGLETLDSDLAYLCEHDVFYSPDHFKHDPPRNLPFYNQNVWKVDSVTGQALHYLCNQTSGLCCNRQVLIDHYKRRIATMEQRIAAGERPFVRSMGFEPGTRQLRHGGIDDMEHDTYFSETPNVDIRHGSNLTPSRWKKEEFRNQRFTKGWTEGDGVPGWGSPTRGRFIEWMREITQNTIGE